MFQRHENSGQSGKESLLDVTKAMPKKHCATAMTISTLAYQLH